MRLENLQNLSKLKKNMRAQLFLSGCTHIFFEKTVVHAYFLEFGESLEILQAHFSSFFAKKILHFE